MLVVVIGCLTVSRTGMSAADGAASSTQFPEKSVPCCPCSAMLQAATKTHERRSSLVMRGLDSAGVGMAPKNYRLASNRCMSKLLPIVAPCLIASVFAVTLAAQERRRFLRIDETNSDPVTASSVRRWPLG